MAVQSSDMIDLSRRFLFVICVLGSILSLVSMFDLASAYAADKYPAKPITIIVPFPAGSVADTITRRFGQHLSENLKASVVVENKAGAGGMIGAGSVARAPADGYTLLLSTNTTHSAVEALFKTVPYNPLSDFVHIARVARVPTVIAVKADGPFKTIGEVVTFAKASPGKLEYGHGNSSGQLMAETFKSVNSLDIVRVSYRGVPQVLNDLLGGKIAMAAIDLTSALPLVQAGSLRLLAVSTKERSELLPDVPTLSDTAVPGYDLTPWFGFAGPAGVPPDVIEILAKEFREFISKPGVRQRFSEIAVDLVWVGPDQMMAFAQAERVKWTSFVKAAGIPAE